MGPGVVSILRMVAFGPFAEKESLTGTWSFPDKISVVYPLVYPDGQLRYFQEGGLGSR
jgi:hypothetical protein